jgi:hypothetical protein
MFPKSTRRCADALANAGGCGIMKSTPREFVLVPAGLHAAM